MADLWPAGNDTISARLRHQSPEDAVQQAAFEFRMTILGVTPPGCGDRFQQLATRAVMLAADVLAALAEAEMAASEGACVTHVPLRVPGALQTDPAPNPDHMRGAPSDREAHIAQGAGS